MSGAPAGLTRGEFLIALAGVCGLAGSASGQEQDTSGGTDASAALRYPHVIVLVRHAEKSAEPANDPLLSEAGVARAQRLAQLLARSGTTHLYATEFARTKDTLAPLGAASQRPVTSVSARDAKGLISALDSLPRGALAVVAGHSNTIPALVERLSGGRLKPTIDESEYDKLFVVIQWGEGRGQQYALELSY